MNSIREPGVEDVPKPENFGGMGQQVMSPDLRGRRWSWAPPALFALAVMAAIGIVGLWGFNNLKSVNAATTARTAYPLPRIDWNSPTGYVDGQRRVIMPRGVDGYHWIMHAQRMAADGKWRVREMPDDNFPAGRELHWSQFLLWWLVLLGRIVSEWQGIPLGAAIENAAVWAQLPIHVLLILGLPLAIRRRFGWIAASLLAVGMATVYTFAVNFMVGAPDHHGLAAAAIMSCALFLAAGGAGWVRSGAPTNASNSACPTESEAGRWCVASGVAGGVAMWISAATALPAFVGMGLGIGLSMMFLRSQETPGARYEARFWRVWGIASGATSLFFYLLEYAPNHFGLRLEVNHPLYALALVGAGEILFRVTRSRVLKASIAQGMREWAIVVFSLMAVATPALVILGLGARVFQVRDPLMWALHANYISEFQPLFRWLKTQGPEALIVFLNPLWLLAPTVLRLTLCRAVTPAWKSVIIIPASAAATFLVLSLSQSRWLNIADALWLATLAAVAGCIFRSGDLPRFHWVEKTLAACFVVALSVQMPQLVVRETLQGYGRPPNLDASEMEVIFARDIAYRVRAMSGRETPVVVSAPTATTWMMYFGGMRGLGTLYWENRAGLDSAARIYAARDERDLAALLRARQVSHLVILSTEPYIRDYPLLLNGKNLDTNFDTVVSRMAAGLSVPPWATEIPVPMPAGTDLWALAFDVRQARNAR